MTATWHPSQGRKGPGRPERSDWREPAGLADEPDGTYLFLHLRTGNRRLRARLVAVTDGGIEVEVHLRDGLRTIPFERILRYRAVPSWWFADDFVVRRGVPAADWRGIVVAADGEEVTVDAYPKDNRKVVDGTELEMAADRPHDGTRVL